MSIVDLDAAAEARSALGAATLGAALEPSSFLAGAGFAGASVEVERCGMFLMSLYFACLGMKKLARRRYLAWEKRGAYVGGAAVVPSLRSVMISIS